MKYSLPLVLFVLNGFFCSAQIIPETIEEKSCSRMHDQGRVMQVSYYQYPEMGSYDVYYLKLDLNAEAGSRQISGNSITKLMVVQPLDTFITEFKDPMLVDSVLVNGVSKNFLHNTDHVFVPLSSSQPVGTNLTIQFYYHGLVSSNALYAGTVASNGLQYSATLSESYQAREWFPVKQQLKDKIDSADIWIRTSKPNYVGSNGLLVAIVDSPGNTHQFQWKTRYPMNYYMPSFSIGNYREYINYAKPLAMAPDSIPILHYLVDNQTYFNSVKLNLDKTPAFIEKFSSLYGLYPFYKEKYGHAHAAIGGGMEHQTMSTMNSFGTTLIAHELAHQWWGDQVTCATWNHIWLNEGFASYGEYLAVENLPSYFTLTPSAYMQSFHTSAMSLPTGSVFVPESEVFNESRIFSNRLSYRKGASIIHTLRFEMGHDSLFFKTLQNYQIQFRDSVATANDFKTVSEAVCNRSFNDFFTQWYYGEGYPTYSVRYFKLGVDSVGFVLNQTASAPTVTPLFKGLLELQFLDTQIDTIVRVNVQMNEQEFHIPYNSIPTSVLPDPANWILNKNDTMIYSGIAPERLKEFTGLIAGNCNTSLQWTVMYEYNCGGYTIEHSEDGINFVSVGFQQAANNAGSTTYSFVHNTGIAPVHYYRLAIRGNEGSDYYSDTLILNQSCGNEFSVSMNPNPASNETVVTINQPQKSDAVITIYVANGARVYKESVALQAGINALRIEKLKTLAAGSYVLVVQTDKDKATVRFVK